MASVTIIILITFVYYKDIFMALNMPYGHGFIGLLNFLANLVSLTVDVTHSCLLIDRDHIVHTYYCTWMILY